MYECTVSFKVKLMCNYRLQLKFHSRKIWLLLITVGFNLMNGIRAGVSMGPDVSIGQIPRLFHVTIDHLYCQSGRTEDVCGAVGLCEATEGWRVRDFIIKEILHQLLALFARCFQLIIQLRNQILDVPHQCGAQTKQAEQKNQTSTDARDKVESHSFREAWKRLKKSKYTCVRLNKLTVFLVHATSYSLKDFKMLLFTCQQIYQKILIHHNNWPKNAISLNSF